MAISRRKNCKEENLHVTILVEHCLQTTFMFIFPYSLLSQLKCTSNAFMFLLVLSIRFSISSSSTKWFDFIFYVIPLSTLSMTLRAFICHDFRLLQSVFTSFMKAFSMNPLLWTEVCLGIVVIAFLVIFIFDVIAIRTTLTAYVNWNGLHNVWEYLKEIKMKCTSNTDKAFIFSAIWREWNPPFSIHAKYGDATKMLNYSFLKIYEIFHEQNLLR